MEAVQAVVTEIAAFDFEPLPLNEARLMAPVTPSKIVCVGRNYREHARSWATKFPPNRCFSSSRRRRCWHLEGWCRCRPRPSAWTMRESWRW